jgi:hypothetical protein
MARLKEPYPAALINLGGTSTKKSTQADFGVYTVYESQPTLVVANYFCFCQDGIGQFPEDPCLLFSFATPGLAEPVVQRYSRERFNKTGGTTVRSSVYNTL